MYLDYFANIFYYSTEKHTLPFTVLNKVEILFQHSNNILGNRSMS